MALYCQQHLGAEPAKRQIPRTNGNVLSRRLESFLQEEDELQWTEQEIVEWANLLPPDQRRLFYGGIEEARRRGFDLHRFACKLRMLCEEAIQKQQLTMTDHVWLVIEAMFVASVISGRRKL